MEIRHHPDDEMLLALAAGQLQTGTRLVVASHLELCPACAARARTLGALGGVLLEALPPEPLPVGAFDQVLARIDAGVAVAAPARRLLGPPPLPQDAMWPRALAQCTATRWRWIAPGMRLSRISVPGAPEANVFLLRIGAGKYLPQHTHNGLELTQILHGSFHDGRALFGPGDFDAADGDVHHQPVVREGSDCICLASVEGNLRFDGFIARWLGALVGM